jgi:hypothetical protein
LFGGDVAFPFDLWVTTILEKELALICYKDTTFAKWCQLSRLSGFCSHSVLISLWVGCRYHRVMGQNIATLNLSILMSAGPLSLSVRGRVDLVLSWLIRKLKPKIGGSEELVLGLSLLYNRSAILNTLKNIRQLRFVKLSWIPPFL